MNEGSGRSLPVLCLAWQDVSTRCCGTDSQNQLTAAECSFDAPMFISQVVKPELVQQAGQKSYYDVNVDCNV